MPKPRKYKDVLSIFAGYPVSLIQQWTGVSKATAKKYKNSTRSPSRPVLRLFTLFSQGRVLDDHWQGWSVRDGVLYSPNGLQFNKELLAAYPFIVGLARFNDPESLSEVWQMMSELGTELSSDLNRQSGHSVVTQLIKKNTG